MWIFFPETKTQSISTNNILLMSIYWTTNIVSGWVCYRHLLRSIRFFLRTLQFFFNVAAQTIVFGMTRNDLLFLCCLYSHCYCRTICTEQNYDRWWKARLCWFSDQRGDIGTQWDSVDKEAWVFFLKAAQNRPASRIETTSHPIITVRQ